jgi:hypothetical protein
VEKKTGDTWIHKDKKAHSTWKHVEGVNKIDYLTSNLALENVANTKSNQHHLRSCENSKTETPT